MAASNQIMAELDELIRKNLPAHVGETLKLELEELSVLRKRAPALEAEFARLNKRIAEYQETERVLRERLEQHGALDAKREEVEQQTRDMKVTLLEGTLAYERTMNTRLFDLVGVIFRNPVVTDHIITSGQEVVSSNGYPTTLPVGSTETHSRSITK